MACIRSNPQTGILHTFSLDEGTVDTYWHAASVPGAPLILEFHGGGMVLGHGLQNDLFCQKLSESADASVISVDYCTAPEHPYPEAIDQAVRLLNTIVHDASVYSPQQKLILMGFSGGATIAAAAALRCNADRLGPHIDGLILHYPYLDAATDPADKPGPASESLPTDVARAFNQLYCAPEQYSEPYASPLTANDSMIRSLPFTALLMAESDFLCEEGKQFARRLTDLNVPVYAHVIPKVSHGYVEDFFDKALYEGRGGASSGPAHNAMCEYAPTALAETIRVVSAISHE